MSTPNLDNAIRDAYASVEPPAGLTAAVRRSKRETKFRRSAWGAAAVAVVAAAIAIVVVAQAPGHSGLSDRLADEVWRHYLVLKPPEVRGNGFGDLAAQLPRLDFELRAPRLPTGWFTEGARYCSVDGELAAQIQLRDENGHRYALYVTRARPKFDPLTDRRVRRDGGSVRVWREAGLVYALAGPIPADSNNQAQ